MDDLTELTDDEVAGRAAHLAAEIERRRPPIVLHPHRVHQKGAIDTFSEPALGPAEDRPGDPRPEGLVVTGSTYTGVHACPDCGMGLVGRQGGMACARIPIDADIEEPCHPGCILACGKED